MDYQKTFSENLKKRSSNTYKFSNQNTNKFILLLQKGAYSYEYLDDWKKFKKYCCLRKKIFTVV